MMSPVPADVLLMSNSRPPDGDVPFAHAADTLREHLGGRTVWFVAHALAGHDDYTAAVGDALRRVLGADGLDLRGLHREPDPARVLADADPAAEAVFVGGGNTFRLLREVRDLGILDVLRRRDDLRYSGASAGSNLACPTVMTTNDMPIVDPGGLDAVGRVPFQINPHYLDPDPASTHRGETRAQRIAEFHEMNTAPVVGLREGAWLLRRCEGPATADEPDDTGGAGDTLTLVGHTARIFRAGEEPTEHAAGTDLTWLLAPTSS